MTSGSGNPAPPCRRIAPLLDDLVDGRLSEAQQVDVSEHLAGCAACRERFNEVEQLLARVDGLPRSVEPPGDLWPAIAPRLLPRPPRATESAAWPGWLRQAAAAMLFMALGAVLSQILLPGWRSEPVAWLGGTPAPAAQLTTPRDSIDRRADFAAAEADYLRAKESLWSAVYASRDTASQETREVVERNLRVIDQAIRELRQALQDDPGNPQLENLLLAQHRNEIDLLQRLALSTSEI